LPRLTPKLGADYVACDKFLKAIDDDDVARFRTVKNDPAVVYGMP